MPRRLREAMGGLAYHVLNRAVGRSTLFKKDADYAAFEEVLLQAWDRFGTRIVSYCLMPNHWHLVLWPRADGELSKFMGWLTVTHAQRRHAHYRTGGTGPVYQGRFKSFPIQRDHHFLTVCRYVERNPLRAKLVRQADRWQWCSLWRRRNGKPADRAFLLAQSAWPIKPPRNWIATVQRAATSEELADLRRSVVRGAPYGAERWQQRTASKLGLDSTLRPRGRPKQEEE
ncbi:MAG: transposase [Planctomycetota bacterium]|nr:transposase [Planctomycetota bacterium]